MVRPRGDIFDTIKRIRGRDQQCQELACDDEQVSRFKRSTSDHHASVVLPIFQELLQDVGSQIVSTSGPSSSLVARSAPRAPWPSSAHFLPCFQGMIRVRLVSLEQLWNDLTCAECGPWGSNPRACTVDTFLFPSLSDASVNWRALYNSNKRYQGAEKTRHAKHQQ